MSVAKTGKSQRSSRSNIDSVNMQTKAPQDLGTLADTALLQLRARLEMEMRRRWIAFSVGAVGEQLAVDFFAETPGLPNLQPAPVGTKNVDALSRNGDRYSIKTICNGKKTGTVYPDSEDPDKQLFEFLLVVRLSQHWDLLSIYQFTWRQFLSVRAWDKRMNAWYVGISSRTLAAGELVCGTGLQRLPSLARPAEPT